MMWVAISLLSLAVVCLSIVAAQIIYTSFDTVTRVTELERQIVAMYEPLVERPVFDEPLFFDMSFENNTADYEEDRIGDFEI